MISIQLFGPIGVSVDGVPVARLSGKQRQILALLALHPGVPMSRERLADQLWEGAPPASYVGTLDSYVCVLRRALGLSAGRSSDLATTSAGFVFRDSAEIEVDLHWFHRLARAAEMNRRRAALEWAEEAVALVGQGELLADVPYAEWAVAAREEFRRSFVELTMRAAQRANGLGDYERAESLARLSVAHDRVCESGWHQLMVARWFSGHRSRALEAYAEFRAAMADRLGEEPGEVSQQLYLEILRSTPDAAPTGSPGEEVSRLRTLLDLLRQELELVAGIRPPALDADLSRAATQILAGVR